jgi:hypothetical protein
LRMRASVEDAEAPVAAPRARPDAF